MRLRRIQRVAALLACALALPAAAQQAPAGPDDDPGYGAPAISWSGLQWVPRVSVGADKPYSNQWSAAPNVIYVDSSDRLHLWLREVAGSWLVGQIRSVKSDFGYGTYTFTVETPISRMDPNEVLGLFTRNNLPSEGEVENGRTWTDGQQGDPRYVDHAETDVEIGRWDWAARGYPHRNAQFVVQPWWLSGRTKHLWLRDYVPYTVQFTWKAHRTVFTVTNGATPGGPVLARWTSHATNGEPRLGTQVCVEAWLIFDRGPARGREQEVVLDSFSYEPLPA